MRPRHLALAAMMILGCDGGATASPPKPSLPVMSLFSRGDIQTVRWRHRYRRDFWGTERDSRSEREVEGAGRADTNGFSGFIRLMLPEAARPAPRRRGGWVDPPPLH